MLIDSKQLNLRQLHHNAVWDGALEDGLTVTALHWKKLSSWANSLRIKEALRCRFQSYPIVIWEVNWGA